RPDRRGGSPRHPAHEDGAARTARRPPGDRRRTAGGAVREPGEDAPHDGIPRAEGPTMKVGILGGGRMGAGIAHAFLLTGCDVAVVERDEGTADAAAHRIRESIASSVDRRATPRS